MRTKDELIAWLRDAYAMEKAMELALKKQIDNQRLPMEARELASAHLTETESHATAVHACLRQLGADTSLLKTTMAQSMELVKSASTLFAGDEHIKDILAAYAAEHFEIACYTALAEAARDLDVRPIVDVCEANLKEETRMAEQLQKNLPAVVRNYLHNP